MQKIVIDTNVIVSAFIQRGYPYQIITELFIDNKIELCISDEVLEEYIEVLGRKKFSRYPGFVSKAKAFIPTIELKALMFYPKKKIKLLKDIDDNKFLELAEESNAHFLITGNTNDFTIAKYKRTKIVTPSEYWEKYRPTF